MTMTNAERQAKYRAAGRAARALTKPRGDGLTEIDAAILGRLFGPEIDLSDFGVCAVVAEAFEVAKGVEFTGEVVIPEAMNALLASVVATGLGGAPAGWSILKVDGAVRLDVWRFKAVESLAA